MIFDAHFHIISPGFPILDINDYTPEPFTLSDYREKTQDLAVAGGAIVSGSFQGTDQSYLLCALKELSPTYVGVTQLKSNAEDDLIIELDRVGVRAVRFNVVRGGSEDIAQIEAFAKRLYDLAKWHVELYIDSVALEAQLPILEQLPKYSIDHLGLSEAGLPHLYRAVEQGAHVKATGFMRCDFEVLPVLQQIHSINPNALMFGTDLPGTRASRQFAESDLALIQDNFAEKDVVKITWSNAAEFYGIIMS